ncbi:type II CAAX prenyl endopeptidase Rce1 family protein [Chloroflexota bacterium]
MGFDLAAFIARLREAETPPPWPVRTGLALWLAYLVIRIVALAGVSMAVDAEAAALGMLSPAVMNLAMIVAALVTLGLILLVVRRYTALAGSTVTGLLRLGRYSGSILLLILAALGAAMLIDFVQLLAGTIVLPVNLQGLAAGNMAGWLLAGAYMVLFGPLVETLLLQGVLYPVLAVNRDNLVALLFTALLFMLLRVFDNPVSPVLWVESFLTGVFITGVRAHQKSTRSALIAAVMIGVFTLYKGLRLLL